MGRALHRVHLLMKSKMKGFYTANSFKMPAHESHSLVKILRGGLTS